jgi:hypothetical protein
MPFETPDWLAKERIIAAPGFNRWLVPPAALAIHLCIGMAYGFSVFWLPLSKAIGIRAAIACGPQIGFLQELTVTGCDWKISTLGWMSARARPPWSARSVGAAACWFRRWAFFTINSG